MVSAVVRVFSGSTGLTYRQGAALVAGSGIVFSFTALVFRAVEEADDWQFLSLRGGSMAGAMVLLTLARRSSRPVDFSGVTWRVGLAGALLAGMSMLYILALARTTAATAAFLQASAPAWGAVFGWLLLRERVRMRTVFAMGIAAVGVGIMVASGLDAGSTSGVLLAACIPVALGLYNTLLRGAPDTDPVVPALIAGVVLFTGSSAVAMAQAGLAVPLRDVLLGVVAGGVLLGVGIPLFNLGHRSVPSAQVSLLLMTEVVLAPFWVWIWPGEQPSAATLVGGAVVLAGVVWQITATEEIGLPPSLNV